MKRRRSPKANFAETVLERGRTEGEGAWMYGLTGAVKWGLASARLQRSSSSPCMGARDFDPSGENCHCFGIVNGVKQTV